MVSQIKKEKIIVNFRGVALAESLIHRNLEKKDTGICLMSEKHFCLALCSDFSYSGKSAVCNQNDVPCDDVSVHASSHL